MSADTTARTESGATLVRRWRSIVENGSSSSPVMTANELARQFAVLHPDIQEVETLVRTMLVDVGLHLRSRSVSFERLLASASETDGDAPSVEDAAAEQAVISALAQLLDDREISRDQVFDAARCDVRELAGSERPGINL